MARLTGGRGIGRIALALTLTLAPATIAGAQYYERGYTPRRPALARADLARVDPGYPRRDDPADGYADRLPPARCARGRTIIGAIAGGMLGTSAARGGYEGRAAGRGC